MEACRDLCLTAPYRCHSFDYGDTGERVCRLSHHTSTTLTQIQVKNYFSFPIKKLWIQNQLLILMLVYEIWLAAKVAFIFF